MIAFDTNFLVRLAVADDAAQVEIVKGLVAENSVFISNTVLLETEWVLRSRYKETPVAIHAFFYAVLASEQTSFENAEAIVQALDWYELGADFADALHLAACGNTVLHTFDQNFCRVARKAGRTPQIRIWQV